ncbi:secreted protein [Rhodopirellula maiorica SM1]|uniref:Secreted protein n=1 Tax=Rhodopirellula maiorica SM1 TaxID=1265738 RepID=M5S4L6_9BACT|nr:hypothetical protein [Rhodopirellula maiorica]EMI22587.1 secreted protein [Rhodopirellula maiorica SM1]
MLTTFRVSSAVAILMILSVAACSRRKQSALENTKPKSESGPLLEQRPYTKHLADFGGLAWCVLFVEADFDRVATSYGNDINQALRNGKWVDGSDSLFDPSGTVVEINDAPWSVIFHSVGRNLPLNTASFASTLNCRVLEYCANDTAGVVDLKLYSPDGSSSRFMNSSDVETENELNEDMGLPPVSDYELIESHSSLFDTMGIPELCIYNAGEGLFAVPPMQRELVGRVRYSPDIPDG